VATSPRNPIEAAPETVAIIYRHLVVHWERLVACFEAFLAIATIHMWIHRFIVG
jgi:hypothetical protein